MITNGQRRNLLVRRINSISADKLQELEAYIANLESKIHLIPVHYLMLVFGWIIFS